MNAKRTARVVAGVILLVIFGVYSYMRCTNWTKSSDVDKLIEEAARDEPVYEPADGDGPTDAPEEPEATPEATPEPTPDPASPEGKALARGLPAPPDIDITSWEFVLVNGDNSIGQYVPPSLEYLGENQCPVDSRIAEPLIAFAQDAIDQGLPVYLSSGYRSYEAQAENFIRVCNNNGCTDGKGSDGLYITMPAGCSEHQTALCCDITDVYRATKKWQDVEPTETYQYMVKHCHEFGFILRFPNGKGDITGVMYEPWHYRYVGVEVATYIMENGLTFEEFHQLYNGVAD